MGARMKVLPPAAGRQAKPDAGTLPGGPGARDPGVLNRGLPRVVRRIGSINRPGRSSMRLDRGAWPSAGWARIFSISTGSSMLLAITRTAPPHVLHVGAEHAAQALRVPSMLSGPVGGAPKQRATLKGAGRTAVGRSRPSRGPVAPAGGRPRRQRASAPTGQEHPASGFARGDHGRGPGLEGGERLALRRSLCPGGALDPTRDPRGLERGAGGASGRAPGRASGRSTSRWPICSTSMST